MFDITIHPGDERIDVAELGRQAGELDSYINEQVDSVNEIIMREFDMGCEVSVDDHDQSEQLDNMNELYERADGADTLVLLSVWQKSKREMMEESYPDIHFSLPPFCYIDWDCALDDAEADATVVHFDSYEYVAI